MLKFAHGRVSAARVDVAEWLTEPALAKYVETFIENDIDFGVVPDFYIRDGERRGLRTA